MLTVLRLEHSINEMRLFRLRQHFLKILYLKIVDFITELAPYLHLLAVINHLLNILFPDADDGALDTLTAAITIILRRYRVVDFQSQTTQQKLKKLFRRTASIENIGHAVHRLELFF